jgi:hypothetical protein
MDLDLMTRPTSFGSEFEVYDAVNAWAGAPAHFYMQVNRMHQGVYQMGYDPEADVYWMRWLQYPAGTWSEWTQLGIVIAP